MIQHDMRNMIHPGVLKGDVHFSIYNTVDFKKTFNSLKGIVFFYTIVHTIQDQSETQD